VSDDVTIHPNIGPTDLESWEAVRRRPGMYVGNTDDGTWEFGLLSELVSNVADQFLAGRATICRIWYEGRTVHIADDGPGLPFDVPSEDERFDSLATQFLNQMHYCWNKLVPRVFPGHD